MKTVGIIGGMSYESSVIYYKLINEFVKNELGGLNSAKVLINSVNFQEIVDCQKSGDWECAGEILGECARKLELAGADYVLLSTNTMHLVADKIQSKINVPFIHIVDATADLIKKAGLSRAGILGTKYTLEADFYKDKFKEHQIEPIIPDEADRQMLNRVIFDELCKGVIKESSKQEYIRVCDDLKERGAQCIVLGCTEIVTLINDADISLPVFDTTYSHSLMAAKLALGQVGNCCV